MAYYRDNYTFEVDFSVSVVFLLVNLTLLMRMRFGDSPITHLSVLPYIVSLALLSLMIFELIIECYLGNVIYEYDLKGLVDSLFDIEDAINFLLTVTGLAKLDFLLLFIVLRAHEQEALL